MNFNYHQFKNVGYISSDLSEQQLAPIKEEIQKIQDNFLKAIPNNHNLAGNIKQEYMLKDCEKHVEKIISPLIYNYFRIFQYDSYINNQQSPIKLSEVWVNFQKKYEFNPCHIHRGIMSFTLWIKIPYTEENEMRHSPGMYSNNNQAGKFEFQYVLSNGRVTATSIFPTEGTVILFPSNMSHQVYPFFTSDDYRISVAGNFNYEISNDKKEN